MLDDLCIEGISGNAHARVPHNVARDSVVSTNTVSTNTGADVNQREVAGAAAEIPNQDEFVVIEHELVVVSRRHRLHLELHRFVASRLKAKSQSFLGITVIFRLLRSHKINRPS